MINKLESVCSVGIIDDHIMFREFLHEKLEKNDFFSEVRSFDNGITFLEFLEKQTLDVILLDIDIPKMNGIEILQKCLILQKNLKVIMLSSYDDPYTKIKTIKLGARAYISKNQSSQEIVSIIKLVYDKGVYFSNEIEKLLLKSFNQFNTVKNKIFTADLTSREISVIKLIAEEKTAKEIASCINVEIKTVEGIKTKIMQKLNVKTSVGIVLFAAKSGILD